MAFKLKRPEGWEEGQVWIRTSQGWVKARKLWRKTGASTWAMRKEYDDVPPGKPTLVRVTTDSAKRQITLVANMPGDPDLLRATLKFSRNEYPTVERDESYVFLGGENDLIHRKAANPNQNIGWTWTVSNYDRKYYISVWAVDERLNQSEPLRAEATIPPPPTPPPPQLPPLAKITYNAVTSGQWTKVRSAWNPNYYGNLVVQAGVENYIGGWFYGGKIRNALANKPTVSKFTIRIQRSSSAHGVAGAANIYLVPHKLDTVGTGSSPALVEAAAPVLVGTLGRNQVKTFNVPTAWWPHFQSGNYRGLGLWAPQGASAWTSPNYVLAYGRGTTSGQVYIEAR